MLGHQYIFMWYITSTILHKIFLHIVFKLTVRQLYVTPIREMMTKIMIAIKPKYCNHSNITAPQMPLISVGRIQAT